MGNKQGTESGRPTPQSHPRSQSSRPQPTSRNNFSFPKMGNANTVKKHVEMASKTGTCQLAKLNLNEFPAEVEGLAGSLRMLDISENRIPTIPPSISQFTMIKSLQISSNRLSGLPSEIGVLKKLETLNVSDNQLSSLPSTITNLKSLKTLVLSQNQFSIFPTAVYALRALDSIDLSCNRITAVPDGISEIQAIEINLNQNQISVLSEDVADCPRLKVLRLEENCLEKAMITPKILKQSNIALLAIDGNLFPAKDFPHFDGYEEYQERYTATKKKMG
ncbi:LRRC57 [Bugula neritina]|uniref:LRRC57 n=1 Tax=Bugula neritina TaxID=10212 RepID=A0A7J7JGF0_BUGNE|nr:LRRC57 [Bugula neritina]